ncbi:hypothetical protein F511_12466 [Dorcoceras hygrometricum]|uniref:Uncharacterized protein n=1 Tax=Dorcoceras hygrometricum TaxID=472368 RepID=A0A2Z7DDA8_9LAMI|nr:hypothetical protein F511_12466 [Dorcoceras hygrometricum]
MRPVVASHGPGSNPREEFRPAVTTSPVTRRSGGGAAAGDGGAATTKTRRQRAQRAAIDSSIHGARRAGGDARRLARGAAQRWRIMYSSGRPTSLATGRPTHFQRRNVLREARPELRPSCATGAQGVARRAREVARLLAPPHAAVIRKTLALIPLLGIRIRIRKNTGYDQFPAKIGGGFDVENPIVLISSGLLVQSDEGASSLVVDRIDESTAINREAPGS